MSEELARQELLAEIAEIVREVIGEAWAEEAEIGLATRFGDDLELESIEFVALAERLQARYGAGVDFAAWLAGMELSQILSLTVGDVVAHVDRCRSSNARA